MSAPSFSSFPPVFSSFPDLDAGSSSLKEKEGSGEDQRKDKWDRKDGDKKKDRHDERHREKGGGKSRKREHGHKSRRSRSRDGDRLSRHRTSDDSTHTEVAYRSFLEPESRSRIFFEDRKGDSLNITYGSLHSGDVPKYRPIAQGYSILGLDMNSVVVYRSGKGVEIGQRGEGRRKPPELTDKRTRALLAVGPVRRFQASAKSLLKYEEVDGFVRIPSRKGKEKEQAYRSIEADNGGNSDSESMSDSEGKSSGYDSDTTPFSAREEALRTLEQKVKNNPASVQDWLHLLAYSLGETSVTNKNASTARADVSVSILRRALAAHEENSRSVILRLKYLRAAEALWHQQEEKLSQEWEIALERTNSIDLWAEWLDWTMRKVGKSFEDTVQNAVRALANIPGHLTEEDADIARLRIFWRVVECMKQAGYVERCTALFQAQAELSFFVPDNHRNSPHDQQLDVLEEFWEAESPRIGEPNAKGWKNSLGSTNVQTFQTVDDIKMPSERDLVKSWCHYESLSDKRLITARRAADMDEEDPFTTVLFSDIRPYLVLLKTRKGCEIFRLMWLTSLGLYIPGLTASLSILGLDDRWAESALTRSKTLQRLFPSPESRHLITADSYAGTTIGREKKYNWSFDVVKEWSLGVLGPFDALAVDGRGRMWENQDSFEVHQELVKFVFQQVRLEDDGLDWDILSLAFDASCGRSSRALKQSQALLSSNSSSPELLATHARLERINNKPEKARKVYRVALSSLSDTEKPGVVLVYWDAAEFEWLSSQSDMALNIVLRAVGQPEGRSGIQLLRAKRRLEELSQKPSKLPWEYQLCWAKLSILLELLTGCLDTAIEVAERFERRESIASPQHEAIIIAKLLLVYHHTITLRNPAPTSVLRNLVQNALEFYPNDTIILGLFLECEKGEAVWGRVKNLTSESSVGPLQDKRVVRRIFEAWIGNWEEGRWLGEIERIRSGLEGAVNSDRTRGSPIIWKIYVRFETTAGDLKKAKAVLFRALRECPLVKELYLLAFEDDLRPVFSNRELLQLADAMAERGIRMRRSLGEMLDGVSALDGEQKREGDSSDEDGDSELEYNSRELRRLMPY